MKTDCNICKYRFKCSRAYIECDHFEYDRNLETK